MIEHHDGHGRFVHGDCEHTPGPGYTAPEQKVVTVASTTPTSAYRKLSKADKTQIREAVRRIENRTPLDELVRSWCRHFKCHPQSVRQTVLRLVKHSEGDINVEDIDGIDFIEVVQR